jgi:hypothetical protein
MATRKGALPEQVRGNDVPLVLGAVNLPPDAATDPDYAMPDAETKGYHTGEIRQPAEPVLETRTGAVAFESVTEQPSAFQRGSLAQMKAAHNDAEAGGIEGEVEHRSITPYADELGERAANERRAAARAAAGGE